MLPHTAVGVKPEDRTRIKIQGCGRGDALHVEAHAGGGNLHLSRHYSLYLALQLKARLEEIPTPVYGLGLVHHTA